MPWNSTTDTIRTAGSPLLRPIRHKGGGAGKGFEYYNNPSHGISVLRLDHLSGEAMNKAKIEEWCRECQAITSSEPD